MDFDDRSSLRPSCRYSSCLRSQYFSNPKDLIVRQSPVVPSINRSVKGLIGLHVCLDGVRCDSQQGNSRAGVNLEMHACT